MTVTEEAVQAIHGKCNNVFYREQSETWHCVGCGTQLDDDTLDSIAKHQTAEMMRLLNGEQLSQKGAVPYALLNPAECPSLEGKAPRLTMQAINDVLSYHDIDGDTTSNLYMCQCGQGYQKYSDFITHQTVAIWELLITAGNRENQRKFLSDIFRRPRS